MDNIIENGTKVRIFSTNGNLEERAVIVSNVKKNNYIVYTISFDNALSVFGEFQSMALNINTDISKPINFFGGRYKMEIITD